MQAQLLSAAERARYVTYGLAGGLLLGMILGWLFHGFVGTLFRILIVILILAPFVAALFFWQKINSRNRVERSGRDEGIDTLTVHESRRIRDAGTVDDRVDDASVRDAEWRERS